MAGPAAAVAVLAVGSLAGMRAIRVLLLRLILKVPVLHRIVSRRFLLLTSVGGHPLAPTQPVRYAAHEGDLIAVGTDRAPWWRQLTSEGEVSAQGRVKGRSGPLTASLARGEALDEAVLRYLQKYPGEWKALGVDPRATADEVEAAANAKPVILLRPARAGGHGAAS